MPDATAPPIVFGTDGWRARIGDEFTYDERPPLRAGRRRVGPWRRGRPPRASSSATTGASRASTSRVAAAEVLLAHDIPVVFASAAIPTQMTSYEVVERGAACAVVITASPQPVDRQRLQDQVARPAPRPARTSWPTVERVIARASAVRSRRAAVRGRRGGGRGRALRPVRGLRGVRAPHARPRATRGPRTCASSSTRCTARAPAGSAGCWPAAGSVVDEIHGERNPWFGGLNPEPIRPNIDEALRRVRDGGYDLGLLLDGDADRAGAADERGTFIHQLQVMGLLMYYLLEHRGERAPVVSTINETSMVVPPRRALRRRRPRDAGRLQVRRAEDDRDRRDDGRRGVGRLRLRHAPARARRHLRRPAAARPVRPRARGRSLAGLAGGRSTSTRSPDRRSTCATTSTPTARPTRRSRSGSCCELGQARAADARRSAGRPRHRARHRRRLQVLDRRRLVAADPLQRHRAARAGLRGGDQRASSATRCSPTAGRWSDRRDRRPAGRHGGGSIRRRADATAMSATATKATILDDPAAMLGPTRRAMLDAVAGFPAQVEDAWRISRAIELPWQRPRERRGPGHGRLGHRRRPRRAASGPIGSRCRWRSCAATTCRRGSAGRRSSWRAPTAARPRRRSARSRAALERRCPVAVITTGGPLGRSLAAPGLPLLTFPGAGPPRASVGYSMAILAGLLERAGVLTLDDAEVDAAVATARDMAAALRPDVPDRRQPRQAARLVARRPARRHRGERRPGAGRATLEDAAQRERQVRRGRRGAARGDPQHGRRLRAARLDARPPVRRVPGLRPATTRATRSARHLTAELLRCRRTSPTRRSRVDGDGRLAQALSAIVLGDYVSVYLAFMYGIDPTPVDVIDHIKARLAEGPAGTTGAVGLKR